MGKLLKKVRHGAYLLSASTRELLGVTEIRRSYWKAVQPVHLPRDYHEAMIRDFQNVGADATSAVSKLHVEQI